MAPDASGLRIGELARRVSVSPELLRAWERRYGLLEPARTTGGFRLYSARDEERVRAMQRYLDQGLGAAQAARSACLEVVPETLVTAGIADSRDALQAALERYDEAAAQAMLDQLFGTYAVESVLSGVILPVLVSIGERWHAGGIGIAEEHFASALLRGRLLALGRGWGRGRGPLAVLASPPGERHDIPLIVFGIALRQSGWRITFLGADTPMAAVTVAADALAADVVALSTIDEGRLRAIEHELVALTRRRMVVLGGPGATPEMADHLGATLLLGDPVVAATTLAEAFPR